MVEYRLTSLTSTDQNGGVRMSVRLHLGVLDQFSPSPGTVVTIRLDRPTDESLADVAISAHELRRLLALRRGALLLLLRSDQPNLSRLKELVGDAIADLSYLDRQLHLDYVSRALQPDFNLALFHRVVSVLPETGKSFMAAFRQEPSADNAEVLYMWCSDLDRTIMNYLDVCSPDRGSVSMMISPQNGVAWRVKQRETASMPLELCAG
ncbi:MAG: hypothetical protein WD024_04445 [Bacillota bacterium]